MDDYKYIRYVKLYIWTRLRGEEYITTLPTHEANKVVSELRKTNPNMGVDKWALDESGNQKWILVK